MGITYRKLRELLNDRGIQLQDLNSNLGLSWETISKIKKNQPMTLTTLEKIARYLNVDIGDLVEIKKDKDSN